ncbi:MAG TPA: CPBP family glutamic-type intramembrane protease [Candidatus Krumholzibacteria bacterium]|nr:CPBP family glutamic-type intramembrane protease [Candidatus Krumholzibacteria bacterium]
MNGDTMFGTGLSHHGALLVGYLLALVAWDRVARRRPELWPAGDEVSFAHPWRELGLSLLMIVGVIGIGQLYQRHGLLPAHGPAGQVFEALNQIIIFSPMLALPLVRRQGWASAWLPTYRVWVRVLIGLILALIATLAFVNVRTGAAPWLDVIRDVYNPKNFGNLVQVLCEDIAIAIVFVRMRAALGLMRSIIVVAVLFAAAHVPAMLAAPVGLNEVTGLIMDAGLGVVVLYFLQRSGDVWWFWMIHFAMDMMQFYGLSGPS